MMADGVDGAPGEGEGEGEGGVEVEVGRIVFTPATRRVSFSRLDRHQVLQVVAGEDRVGFLPTWYYTERVNTTTPVDEKSVSQN